MKLYAQVGHGLGDKVNQGLDESIIDGAILSPKDLQRATLDARISDIRNAHSDADILIDPQFYVTFSADLPNVNIGKIGEWEYFCAYRKSELEQEATVVKVLTDFYQDVCSSDVTAIISPNIFISQSLDSREAVIAKHFIRHAKSTQADIGDTRPLYASLVICREALQDRREFEEFINDITMIDNPPDGIYLVIASRSTEARSDLYHTDVISNWMMLNLSLSINGLKVINGYSDILTPFLGAVGGTAGATGWWSNLRMFSMERFFPVDGGRLPIVRYLSKLLLNRVTFSEKDAIRRFVPGIINGFQHDDDYTPVPERSAEVLQSWETIKSLNSDLTMGGITKNIKNCINQIEKAQEAYAGIAERGLRLDAKSNSDHLEPLHAAIQQFRQRAEL